MAWVKCLAHSRASGNGGWSNILTPSCRSVGTFQEEACFLGPTSLQQSPRNRRAPFIQFTKNNTFVRPHGLGPKDVAEPGRRGRSGGWGGCPFSHSRNWVQGWDPDCHGGGGLGPWFSGLRE